MNYILSSYVNMRYELLEPLGKGGSSKVYLAVHRKLGVFRAIKCISKTNFEVKNALSEAKLLKDLNHPGILKVYDVEEDDDYFYIIEEYVSGIPLIELSNCEVDNAEAVVLDYGIQICEILSYLHQNKPNPILYLDLKPEHLLLSNGRLKLIDFGMARYITDKKGVVVNSYTKGFAPPEVLEGRPATMSADIYQLGCVLYYLLFHQYYDSGTAFIDCSKFNISRKLHAILQKMLSKEPSYRYDSAEDAKGDLALAKKLSCEAIKESGQITNNLDFYVLGSAPHVGTSYISISLVSYLNLSSVDSAMYIEENESDFIRSLSRCFSPLKDRQGIYRCGMFQGIPKYDENVSFSIDRTNMIHDIGYNDKSLEFIGPKEVEKSLVLYVMDGSFWEWEKCAARINRIRKKFDVKVVFNSDDARLKRNFEKQFNITTSMMVRNSSPFEVNRKVRAFWKGILKGGSHIR